MTSLEKVAAGLARRRRKEYLFQFTGMVATAVGVLFLGVFFWTLIGKGASAFEQTFLKLDVELSAEILAPGGELDLQYADFDGLVRTALRDAIETHRDSVYAALPAHSSLRSALDALAEAPAAIRAAT